MVKKKETATEEAFDNSRPSPSPNFFALKKTAHREKIRSLVELNSYCLAEPRRAGVQVAAGRGGGIPATRQAPARPLSTMYVFVKTGIWFRETNLDLTRFVSDGEMGR